MACILVIDDEAQIRRMLRKMLEGAGYEVMEAGDGKAGIEVYQENQPDLVITDLFMPGREGLRVIVVLKRDYPDAKIIAISGHPDYLPAAMELGAHRAFSKPFSSKVFLDSVRGLLEE